VDSLAYQTEAKTLKIDNWELLSAFIMVTSRPARWDTNDIMIASFPQRKKASDRGDDSTSKGEAINPVWLYNDTTRACHMDFAHLKPGFLG